MRVVVAAKDPHRRNQLRQLALHFAQECGPEDAVGLEDLVSRMNPRRPDLILVPMGTERETVLRTLGGLDDSVRRLIFVVGPGSDRSLRSEVLTHGVRGYLDETNLRDEYEKASALLALQTTASPRQRGKVVAVTSLNAGYGVTTIATNLAFALAEQSLHAVVLGELGNGVPEISSALDLEPQNTILGLMDQWQRMDVGMLQRAAEVHPAGLRVLAYPQQTLMPTAFAPKAVSHFVMLSGAAFDFAVFDLGHGVSSAAVAAMVAADIVLVVTRGDVPALRSSREYLRSLQRNGVAEEKILRLANRVGQPRQLSSNQMEEALGLSFHAWIPEDTGSINAAVNQGFPLVQIARNRPIMKRFRKLAELITGKNASCPPRTEKR